MELEVMNENANWMNEWDKTFCVIDMGEKNKQQK